MPSVAAIVVAAGRGTRAGGPVPKAYQTLGGIPMIRLSLQTLHHHPGVAHVLPVIHGDDRSLFAAATQGLNLPASVRWGDTPGFRCAGLDPSAATTSDERETAAWTASIAPITAKDSSHLIVVRPPLSARCVERLAAEKLTAGAPSSSQSRTPTTAFPIAGSPNRKRVATASPVRRISPSATPAQLSPPLPTLFKLRRDSDASFKAIANLTIELPFPSIRYSLAASTHVLAIGYVLRSVVYIRCIDVMGFVLLPTPPMVVSALARPPPPLSSTIPFAAAVIHNEFFISTYSAVAQQHAHQHFSSSAVNTNAVGPTASTTTLVRGAVPAITIIDNRLITPEEYERGSQVHKNDAAFQPSATSTSTSLPPPTVLDSNHPHRRRSISASIVFAVPERTDVPDWNAHSKSSKASGNVVSVLHRLNVKYDLDTAIIKPDEERSTPVPQNTLASPTAPTNDDSGLPIDELAEIDDDDTASEPLKEEGPLPYVHRSLTPFLNDFPFVGPAAALLSGRSPIG